MAITEVQINEQDIASVLQKKIGEAVNLQLRVEAMTRTIAAQDAKIAELEGQITSSNGREASDAKGGTEEIPVYEQG